MRAVLTAAIIATSLLGCKPKDPPPLDMVLKNDGVIYAGAFQVDVTPEVTETWIDGDENGDFNGCFDDPTGASCGSDDTWNDANGDGDFDAVWIAGFGPLRPANSVHDPITITATVLSFDGEYVVFVAMDYVGVHSPRIHEARDLLVADGLHIDKLLVASSHNHQGPDTFGIWGNPFDFGDPVSGIDDDYQARLVAGIETTVREAAANMEPIDLKIGRVRMRDRSPMFNGSVWGGYNPTAKMHGMVNDIRDPVLVSDQLLVLQGEGESGPVFTMTNWSGHPETWGGNNTEISADWVGKTRSVLSDTYGGTVMHMPESLGGMQSALGGDLPLVDETTGEWIMSGETADDGTPLPQWAERNSWDFVQSHGWHIADAAIAALETGEVVSEAPIKVDSETLYFPIENTLYTLMLPLGITELSSDDAVFDGQLCPDLADGVTAGCMPARTFKATVGPVGFVAVPGELLPEIFWGLPDEDPVWLLESGDPTARGTGSTYFPQHDHDCDTLDPADIIEDDEIGDCDCLKVHTWPYSISPDPAMPPLKDLLDTEYKAVLGMTDHYLSYIVPETDYNRSVSYLDGPGDHYEDSVSPAHNLGTRVQEAQLRLAERWNAPAE